MSNAAIMAPVFACIFLMYFVLGKMGLDRVGQIKRREVKMKDVALSGSAWSIKVRQVSNNYNNHMQQPLVFYIVVGFFILLGKVDMAAVILAWAFTISRYIHYYIHIGSNRVTKRFNMFVIGVALVASMWIWLALRLYVIG